MWIAAGASLPSLLHSLGAAKRGSLTAPHYSLTFNCMYGMVYYNKYPGRIVSLLFDVYKAQSCYRAYHLRLGLRMLFFGNMPKVLLISSYLLQPEELPMAKQFLKIKSLLAYIAQMDIRLSVICTRLQSASSMMLIFQTHLVCLNSSQDPGLASLLMTRWWSWGGLERPRQCRSCI